MGKHDAIAEIERRRHEERMRYNAYVTGQLPKPPGSYHRALEHDGKPSLWRRLVAWVKGARGWTR